MSSPTLYSWSYEGADADRASNGGRQHARSADSIYDDEFGVGLIDKLDGTSVLAEFGREGEPKEVKRRGVRRSSCTRSTTGSERRSAWRVDQQWSEKRC